MAKLICEFDDDLKSNPSTGLVKQLKKNAKIYFTFAFAFGVFAMWQGKPTKADFKKKQKWIFDAWGSGKTPKDFFVIL